MWRYPSLATLVAGAGLVEPDRQGGEGAGAPVREADEALRKGLPKVGGLLPGRGWFPHRRASPLTDGAVDRARAAAGAIGRERSSGPCDGSGAALWKAGIQEDVHSVVAFVREREV